MKVRIEKLVYGGDGLGHDQGRAVFIPYVLPGEVVTARIARRNRKVIHAQPQALVEASPERIEARCPYFARCGGCHYQHMEYERQLTAKTEILRETLRHIGKISWAEPIVLHPSPPWAYRNRAQFQLAQRRAAGGPQLEVGYYRAASHALCPVAHCPILSPKLEAALGALNRLAADRLLPDALLQVEALVDDRDEALWLTCSGPNLSVPVETLLEVFSREIPGLCSLARWDTAAGARAVAGAGNLRYRAGEFSYRVSHGAFFQINRFLVDEMAAVATDRLEGEHALDLYAGVGLFTLPLAKRFTRVSAVESDPAAAGDLRANTAESAAVEVLESDVAEFLAHFQESADAVVLDPPRAGAGAAVVEELARLRPRQMVYVSCDPATLARDLGPLVAAGSRIEEIHLFDVFPQTFHLETLVRLARA